VTQKVLIVEDEAIVAEDLSHKVKALGYDVVGVFPTGDQAVHAAQHSTIDLVLLDIQLGGQSSGIETAKMLQQVCDSAIVFTTAHSDPETLRKANATAPFGYILKPFGDRDLAVQLALALHKHQADRALRKEMAERQQAQKQLQRSEAILARAQRGANAGVWEIDLRTGQYTWSKPYYELFDVDTSTVASLDVWLSRIHPEDRSRIATQHQESIQGHRDQDMEFRILKSDGSVRWIRRKGQVEFNEDGVAIRINGISFDITDRKQAEDGINAVASLPAQNPSPVLRIDRGGVLLYMNAASERLLADLRLHPGEPVPSSLRDLVHESLQSGHSLQVEQTLRACDYIVSVTPLVKENYANLYWTDISLRKKSEESLRETSALLNTLLVRAPIGFAFFDSDLRYRLVNDALAEMNGVSIADHLGKTIHEVVPHLAQEADQVLQEVIRTKTPVLNHEFHGSTLKEPGVVRYWNESWYPICGDDGTFLGVGALVQETTELKRQQEQLRQSEERLRLANLATNEAIWDWNVTSDHVVWNQNVVTLFGWSEALTTPQSSAWWVERVHPEDRTRVVDHFFPAVNDPMIVSWVDEYRFQKSDGSYSYVLDRAYALRDSSGKVLRMLGTMLDVTQRRLAEAAVRENEQRLQQAVDIRTAELLQSQEELRAFATQLNLTEQRERQRLAVELHDHLQQLLVLGKIQIGQGKQYAVRAPGCEKVMKTVDEILSEALMYTRTLVADLSPPVLRDYGLAAGLKWLSEYMKRHNLHVSVTVPEHPPKLPEDQTVLLFQSVRELLINASKHTGTGQATVKIAENDGRLEITVRDEGEGFDPAAAAEAPNGGLSSKFGLFSIRERMRAIGGWIEVQSAPGEGTTAMLILPLGNLAIARTEDSGWKAESKISEEELGLGSEDQALQKSAKIRVLLVDDHAMMRQGLISILSGSSDLAIVGEAANGVEALRAVEKHRPAVVIMDINMPDMNGIEATTRIKSRYPEVTVIGLSVNAGDENQQAMLKAGAMMLLTKEAAVEQLYGAIQEVMKKSQPPDPVSTSI
jgi:PAS domain S-box-containing protein